MQSINGSTHDLGLGSIDFLIVTVLPEERDAVLHLLEDHQQIQIDESLTCYICTLQANARSAEYTVAVTKLSQMGNVEAGIHTTRAINRLNPRYVLMVGIAAGIKNRVNLGDVVISTQVIYYEQVRETPDGPEPRPISLLADHSLVHNAQNYNDIDWHDLVVTECPHGRENSLGLNNPKVRFGPIAVGDKVVANQDFVTSLTRYHSKLIGIDMESYGVAMAAASAPTRPRFLAIRGISDFADENKNDDWHECAASRAAAFTIGFLRYGPVSPNASLADITTPQKRSGTLIAIRHMSMQRLLFETIIDSLPSRFKDFSVTELLVDQTDLYNNGRLVDPLAAAKRQANLHQRIDTLQETYPNASLGYFGIAHIPLLFHLGYRLTNKRKLHFFELNRYTERWEYLQGEVEGPELKLDGLPRYVNEEKGDIVIRISISNTVRPEEFTGIVLSPIASLHLYIEPTQRDTMVSEHQLRRYGAKFRGTLDSIHELLPNRVRVHVFYAGPVSLAVYFGQLINQTIDRKMVVYNYTGKDSSRYSWGLEITEETESSDFLVTIHKSGQEGIYDV
jgi:nucleoside phosphorylase